MKCPTCSSELVTGQKFCPQCGTNVAALTLPEPPAGPITLAPPTVEAPVAPLAPPPPDDFAVVEQTVPILTTKPASGTRTTGDGPHPAEPVHTGPDRGDENLLSPAWSISPEETSAGTAAPVPFDQAQFDETDEHAVQAAAQQSQLILGPPTTAVRYPAGYAPGAVALAGRGSTVLAVLTGIAGFAAMVGAFVPIMSISTDAPIPEVGDYKLNDLFLGTNMIVGAVLVGLCLIGGGILATRGWRIGAGLAGGAAVGLAPVLVVIWGQIDLISKSAEAHAVATAAAGQGGTFYRSKQGAGLWILIAAAALGIIALGVAVVQAGADGRPRLNIFLGLGGALAAVVAGIGQMIPSKVTSFGDNFNSTLAPDTVVYGRLAMIALVVAAGAVGFLANNRWGIGLALGGSVFWVWQWLSSLAELGERPFPPGFVPLSTTDLTPHVVTTVGVIAMLVLAAVAVLTAPKTRTPVD